jgi:hypothetical protein
MDRFLELLFGTTDFAGIAVGFIYAMIGLSLSILFETSTRKIAKPTTPNEFDFWFYVRDNKIRLITSLLLIIVGLRFYGEFGYEAILSVSITNENNALASVGLTIGLSSDIISSIIKKRYKLLTDDSSKPN